VYGSKDPATARVLVWGDNRSNTWLNPHNAATAEGTVFIPGMPPGRYSQETWDTRAGTYTKAANAVTVAADGILRFSVGTSRDVAFKFYLGKTAPSVASLYLPHIQN
jgi:hypothetical protein